MCVYNAIGAGTLLGQAPSLDRHVVSHDFCIFVYIAEKVKARGRIVEKKCRCYQWRRANSGVGRKPLVEGGACLFNFSDRGSRNRTGRKQSWEQPIHNTPLENGVDVTDSAAWPSCYRLFCLWIDDSLYWHRTPFCCMTHWMQRVSRTSTPRW